jgi:uncharacterized protein (TIGR03437 family)
LAGRAGTLLICSTLALAQLPPSITEYPIPTLSYPDGITAGPDGALWLAEQDSNSIGRITTAGVITEYPIPTPTPGSGPVWITSGPDGALWFTETNANQIGRITTAGVITEFPIPVGGSFATGITRGPDGALWFTETDANKIGRITTAGVITEYPTPTPDSDPIGITSGPDGALWFTEYDGNQIGRAGPGISEVPIVASGGVLNAASFATDANGHGTAVAPGSLVQIYGTFPGAAAQGPANAPLPTTLGNVNVMFNGISAPLSLVSPTGSFPFINAQIPFELLTAGQTSATVSVAVTVNGFVSVSQPVPVMQAAPGIFTIPPNGQGNAILVFLDPTDQTARIAAPASASIGYPTGPIPRGQGGFFYATGLGNMTPPVVDGDGGLGPPVATHTANATPIVLIGGITAAVQYAGQAPGYPGVNQINIIVPSNAPTGNAVTLQVSSADGTVTSNTATIAVQ